MVWAIKTSLPIFSCFWVFFLFGFLKCLSSKEAVHYPIPPSIVQIHDKCVYSMNKIQHQICLWVVLSCGSSQFFHFFPREYYKSNEFNIYLKKSHRFRKVSFHVNKKTAYFKKKYYKSNEFIICIKKDL